MSRIGSQMIQIARSELGKAAAPNRSTCQNVSFNVSLEVSKSGLSVSILAETLWFCSNWGRVPPSPPRLQRDILMSSQDIVFSSLLLVMPLNFSGYLIRPLSGAQREPRFRW